MIRYTTRLVAYYHVLRYTPEMCMCRPARYAYYIDFDKHGTWVWRTRYYKTHLPNGYRRGIRCRKKNGIQRHNSAASKCRHENYGRARSRAGRAMPLQRLGAAHSSTGRRWRIQRVKWVSPRDFFHFLFFSDVSRVELRRRKNVLNTVSAASVRDCISSCYVAGLATSGDLIRTRFTRCAYSYGDHTYLFLFGQYLFLVLRPSPQVSRDWHIGIHLVFFLWVLLKYLSQHTNTTTLELFVSKLNRCMNRSFITNTHYRLVFAFLERIFMWLLFLKL